MLKMNLNLVFIILNIIIMASLFPHYSNTLLFTWSSGNSLAIIYNLVLSAIIIILLYMALFDIKMAIPCIVKACILFLCLLNLIDAWTFRCGGDHLYDDAYEGCCLGKVYNKTAAGERFECCEGSNQIYNTRTQICCGSELRSRNDSVMKLSECCENNFRRKGIGKCCDGIFYSKGQPSSRCCGKMMINRREPLAVCCNGVLYDKRGKDLKCCGNVSFDVETHYCRTKGLNLALPFDHDVCNGKIYNNSERICCNKTLLKREKGKDFGCCGKAKYIKGEEECSENHVVLKVHSQSTSDKISYDPRKENSNGNKISDYDSCAGKKYDRLNKQCCGDKIVEKSKHCCAGKVLDTKNYVCCKNREMIKKVNNSDDACCTSLEKPVSYDENFQRCTPDGVVNIKCIEQTTGDDLCCQSQYDENFFKDGRKLKMECCGNVAYFTANETCTNRLSSPKVVPKRKMTEKTTIPITNKAALEIKRTCGKESYNNTTDLCCGNNLFRGGKDKNISCCSGEAARQSCTNGIEKGNTTCSCEDICITKATKKRLITEGYASFCITKNKFGLWRLRKSKRCQKRKQQNNNKEKRKSRRKRKKSEITRNKRRKLKGGKNAEQQKTNKKLRKSNPYRSLKENKRRRRNQEIDIRCRCDCIKGKNLILLMKSRPKSRLLEGEFYLIQRNRNKKSQRKTHLS